MEKIVMYENKEFGKIRTMVMPDGQIGFVGKDVAKVLGYRDTVNALKLHVEDEDKARWQITTQFGVKEATFINESGLYALVLASKMPRAREFKHWVTAEVLPQIRRTGGYIPIREGDDEEAILSRAVAILTRTVEVQRERLAAHQAEIARLKPRADYAEEVLLSPTCYTMTQVAKGLSMTVQELQRRLRELGVIYRSPSGPWMLYAPYLRRGLEAYRTRKGDNVLGEMLWTESYLVWTEKGREFVNRLFLKQVG